MSSSEEQSSKKTNSRNILTILDRMIRVIPDEVEENFKCDLQHLLEKAAYTPPENINTVWRDVQYIITERFKAHSDTSALPQWSILLIDIWTDKKQD